MGIWRAGAGRLAAMGGTSLLMMNGAAARLEALAALGWRVARPRRATKKERREDRLICGKSESAMSKERVKRNSIAGRQARPAVNGKVPFTTSGLMGNITQAHAQKAPISVMEECFPN